MLPENLEWKFPSSAEEAVELLRRPGAMLHGGGTRILKTNPKGVKLLIDVGALGLGYINYIDNAFYIGSDVTFSEIVKYSKKENKIALLGEALSNAASTPLRNRITIGGSLKDFPIWSSLYAPLIALKARVEILKDKPEIYSVEDYVLKGVIKTKHVIRHVIIDDEENLICGVKRFSVLRFEYPVFTIAAALKINGQTIKDARLVITGVKKRFKRFIKAENALKGQPLGDLPLEGALRHINPVFIPDYKFSARYKESTARVYFSDLLNELTEQIKGDDENEDSVQH
ncbi:MAG TPA: FAD binding domain-containing protein [Ignavibacteriales bacterium]|nr:FAD binding domain-containing protein [Ignavibacteriales bacterium]